MPTNTPLPSPSPIPLPVAARLDGFRHQFQTWNNCGPATTAMALSYFGLDLDQAETAVYLKPNPEDRNVSPYEISRYVNEQTPYGALERTNGTLSMIKRLVAGGFPVMIELGIEPPGEYRWLGWYGHYLLVVAYDDTQEQFWVYDSWFGTSDRPMENAT
ncbi:MAG: C39 family peptidase, partial [Anaerolineales bacterium]|nr:C39 family peptidase [Anaerolineales bacterium]